MLLYILHCVPLNDTKLKSLVRLKIVIIYIYKVYRKRNINYLRIIYSQGIPIAVFIHINLNIHSSSKWYTILVHVYDQAYCSCKINCNMRTVYIVYTRAWVLYLCCDAYVTIFIEIHGQPLKRYLYFYKWRKRIIY